jgi:cation diffusion facilitator family transporter
MDRIKTAKKVTWVGFFVNLVLTALKILAGISGKSTAMIADGIHSLSDFITDVLVIIFVGISGKEKDTDHHYGHGKYETFATMIISMILMLVGIGIFWSGLNRIIDFYKGEAIEEPSIIAFWAAILSIIVKEWLYWYTKKAGELTNNFAVIANAWHHRSDAFSSIGTAIGIAGAIFLGENWRILDPIAGMIVSLFIIKVATEIGLPSMHELLEKSLPVEIETEISNIIKLQPEVKFHHNLKTRKVGYLYVIDVHIKLDRNISFVHSHDVATDVEKSLKKKYGEKTVVNVHTEPFNH